ncbi:hypothetical protein Achl_4256 (plasmid) [Pseudarthrobacter chlorophenolicus A6]|uniref:Uncharacterized protein n=1 Tax=Pseudarthrobacter chlorophenolicus (strain ATCC 700700 / DSM 12829 / CIP 107037 / JCM 12360 / KCTC 9906 / NCIMB 13794 / A6) TaxID=452863 RepID=B8HIG0_PSECP|nr:hypothetical protein [Pseudarthrobacter chlorophenolicus]ACL42207.1 hypothetical protein Achl_4256 [Pseudarthrobacter chlorophenolicus A6]SDQ14887.1 hypothetical protein SAMN04489738_0314 [Pseudarthrobacter chlorophenolicus]
MSYTPMPAHLDQQLQAVVREISSPQADAGNTVFVIREALAQAYAAGHKDAHTQAMSHQWITADLKKTYDARQAKLDQAPAPAAAGTGPENIDD